MSRLPIPAAHSYPGLVVSSVGFGSVPGASENIVLVPDTGYGFVGPGHDSRAFTGTHVRDGSILPHTTRNLGSRTYNRSGRVGFRTQATHAASTSSNVGTGALSSVRAATTRKLIGGSRSYTPPPVELAESSFIQTWSASGGTIDRTIKGSANVPGYRITGSQFYGPSGYWVTKNFPGLRIGNTVAISWSARNFELPSSTYSFSIGGTVLATGTIDNDTTVSYDFDCVAAGVFTAELELSDTNGVTATLPPLQITVFDAPILHASFNLPIPSGRYRLGNPVTVRFTHDSCTQWSLKHTFEGAVTEVGRGALAVPAQATTEIVLTGLALGDHLLDLTLSDPYGAQLPAAATVQFEVVDTNRIISD